ncbi:MAG: leucine--tRNA ligase [Candidatus Omnitrophota bacterium]|nr:leucine--tRNA ligase [Candidatus Omnitrophota bacterium]
MAGEFYPFKEIEAKWHKKWEEMALFKMDSNSSKPKYYCLMMFPYPSAALHVGHGRNYIIGDSVVRYKIMRGYNVLSPMGFDAFGLPAENAAIKNGIHPEISTLNNIKTMRRQFDSWGAGYDWDREVVSCLPIYYKWTQWIFLQLYKKGLAYKKKASVNWCPSCQTVLANEQVINGECERCSSQVTLRDLEQWFFKITEYSQRLLEDMELLKDWPERVKLMQKNWIGRSQGVEIDFKVKDSDIVLRCFTTRADTIYGVTYMVISNEHPAIQELIKDAPNKKEIETFISETRKENAADRVSAEQDKKGIFTGRFAINPMNNKAAPLWIGNYVVTEYGTGAVMAVPGHDQRDFEFAKKYGLGIEVVIDNPRGRLDAGRMKEAYIEEGVMVNSGQFNGLPNMDAVEKIADFMEEKKIGKKEVHYKLRDWLISRQRYWGAPIPMVYCGKCGMQPVDEKDLPVLLPKNVKFKPHGESPLKDAPEFVNTKCPECGGSARREIDTMDTFVDSSWYFLRYLSPKDDKKPFDKDLIDKWMPIDQYIGGVEHAILHLLYSRFIIKVLCDMGHVGFKEPFAKLFTQGMITKNGIKMSKSRGNVVSSDDLIEKYGADTVRLYTLFISPPEKDAEWNDRGVEGAWRFLNRVWRLIEDSCQLPAPHPCGAGSAISCQLGENSVKLRRKTHAAIKKVTEDMEGTFHFNTAISSIMELVNETYDSKPFAERDNHPVRRTGAVNEAIQTIVILLAPFVPHIAEEMWQKLGNKESVFKAEWPMYDKNALSQSIIEFPIQINGKLRSKIEAPSEAGEDEIKKLVLKDSVVNKWLEGKAPKKIIIVKGKLVNLVI